MRISVLCLLILCTARLDLEAGPRIRLLRPNQKLSASEHKRVLLYHGSNVEALQRAMKTNVWPLYQDSPDPAIQGRLYAFVNTRNPLGRTLARRFDPRQIGNSGGVDPVINARYYAEMSGSEHAMLRELDMLAYRNHSDVIEAMAILDRDSFPMSLPAIKTEMESDGPWAIFQRLGKSPEAIAKATQVASEARGVLVHFDESIAQLGIHPPALANDEGVSLITTGIPVRYIHSVRLLGPYEVRRLKGLGRSD